VRRSEATFATGRYRAGVPRLPGPGPTSLSRLARLGARRPHELAAELHELCGPVAQLGAGPMRFVYLFGRDANEMILGDGHASFTWREAFRGLAPVTGPSALILSDGDDHRRRRRLVQPAFGTRRIDASLPVIVEELDRSIDALTVGQVMDLYSVYRRTVRRIVARVLFGDALAGRADELGDVLEPAMSFVDRPPQYQVPGTLGWLRARRSRRGADRIIDAEIARRRSEPQPSEGHDVLAMLLDTGLDDGEIRDQVVSLIAAGYDTTSAAVGWTVLELLRTAGEWDRVRAEVAGRLDDGRPPSPEDLRSLPYVAAVVDEAVRLWPPASLSARRCSEPVEHAGHVIPAGAIVLFSPYVTHRSTDLWGPDAGTFRPGRWLDREPEPFTYIPFGGAYRRCIGFALALAEVQAVVVRLAQRTRLTLVDPDREVRGTGLSALRPDGGVLVRVDAVSPPQAPRPESGG
jgi:cytochrome P450